MKHWCLNYYIGLIVILFWIMDSYTQDVLKQWGFSAEIITIFKGMCIIL